MNEKSESTRLDPLTGEACRPRSEPTPDMGGPRSALSSNAAESRRMDRPDIAADSPADDASSSAAVQSESSTSLNRQLLARTQEAEERSRQLHQLAVQLTQAENRERRRLALALHDGLQQLLIAARMKLGALEHKLKGDPNCTLAQRSLELIDEAITASRSLSVELSPPMLYEAGLAATLDWLSRHMEEKHGLQVEVHSNVEPQDHDINVFLFQCIRELLLNIVKHAEVLTARIIMRKTEDDRVTISVSDEGCGFDLNALQSRLSSSESFGLRSIHERMKLLGGRCEIDTAPGEGTRVVLIAPLRRLADGNVF